MLSLGITLENCDIVMLFNDTLSCDKTFQQMYRCMTESDNNDKKYGFVVDLNTSRVLNTCMSYNIAKKDINFLTITFVISLFINKSVSICTNLCLIIYSNFFGMLISFFAIL